MDKRIRIEIAIGVIVFIALIVGGVIWMTSKEPLPVVVPVVEMKKPVTSPVVQSENEEYRSSLYGFSLRIPKSWDGYTVALSRGKELADKGATAWFDFDLPDYTGVFSVIVYNQSQWKKVSASLPSASEMVVSYPYVILFGQGMLLSSGNLPVGNDLLASQLMKVEEIKKSLRRSEISTEPYWNTYRNVKYNLAFQYPENWLIENATYPDMYFGLRLWSSERLADMDKYQASKFEGEGPSSDMFIFVYDSFSSVRNVYNTEAKNLAELMKQEFFQNVQSVTIDGEPGYRVIDSGLMDGNVWFIPHQGKYYKFVTDYKGAETKATIEDKIIETFKLSGDAMFIRSDKTAN